MSSKRLNKRQLREQQELDELAEAPLPTNEAAKKSAFQQLAESDDDDQDDDEEEEEAAPVSTATKKPTTTSLFAALGDGAEEEEEQDDSEPDQDISTQQAAKSNKKKNKKKKKKAAAAATADNTGSAEGDTAQQTPSINAAKKSTKKKPTAPTPAAKLKDVSEMSIDEFDALLASQASLNTDSSNSAPSSSSNAPSANRVSAFRTHLALDPRNLDPSLELRRQFGSAAIKAYQSEAASSAGGGRATNGARARAQATNPNLKVRSLLCTPQPHWPPIARSFTGMSMDILESPSGRTCVWRHSKAYRQVQMQFLQAVRSYDPNSLMALLRVYPYHVDTLLQLSEYSRHQGDLGQAADFNDRALFVMERCASPFFTSCLSSSTSGPPVVSFAKVENRAFYMAIHRNIGFLGRRGTWRTALEWAKLLLGCGEDGEDHHAALLWIDFLAVKAKQGRWLVELFPQLDAQRSKGVHSVEELSVAARTITDGDKEAAGEGAGYAGTLDWCVGLAYSRALALRAVEKEEGDKSHTRSNAALRLAIARFPAVVPLLCNKIGIELPSTLAGHPLFQLAPRFSSSSDTLGDLLTHIYVLRSESLWKDPGLGDWLRSTTLALSPALIEDFNRPKQNRQTQPASASHRTRQGIYRHVLVSDVPDTVRQQLIAYLPPSITGSSEQMDSFDPVPPTGEEVTRYDDAYFAPVLSSLPAQRDGGRGEGMMAAFRRALQGLGAGQGWDAAMENMDDETREEVMAQVMGMAQAQRGGGMPGGFGGEEDEQEDGEMEAAGQGAFGAIRAAMDAIWGGRGQPQETHDDEEQEHPHQ
ncbi:Transcription factor 25 [Kalmanozyma brasiliensis GHG001]|uniref:DUF654-domain-containing protein n=1 Tax=Kalmanozyma brasiliensis (strain GHG001) TaxID=1365824 RepID=V5EP20_KALBG|nr:Transcription factor 25 [Kalmanozyma brasiliensis GHG001]EST06850.1 Transcription factor 25 [Kalmanozyma brasiliensis GHG001]